MARILRTLRFARDSLHGAEGTMIGVNLSGRGSDRARRGVGPGPRCRGRCRLIDLQFSDIVGGAKALTIPIELLAVVLEQGYRFDGSALTGGHRKVELDLFLMPDPETLAIFPFEADGQRRARLCCSVLRRDGQPFAGDPRSVLERNLAAARELGYDYRVAVEMEYYLLPGDGTLPDRAVGRGLLQRRGRPDRLHARCRPDLAAGDGHHRRWLAPRDRARPGGARSCRMSGRCGWPIS